MAVPFRISIICRPENILVQPSFRKVPRVFAQRPLIKLVISPEITCNIVKPGYLLDSACGMWSSQQYGGKGVVKERLPAAILCGCSCLGLWWGRDLTCFSLRWAHSFQTKDLCTHEFCCLEISSKISHEDVKLNIFVYQRTLKSLYRMEFLPVMYLERA